MLTLPDPPLSHPPLFSEEEGRAAKKRKVKPLFIIIIILCIVCIAGMVFIIKLLLQTKKMGSEIIVGSADSDIRGRPEDEGGQQILEQEATIYNAGNSQKNPATAPAEYLPEPPPPKPLENTLSKTPTDTTLEPSAVSAIPKINDQITRQTGNKKILTQWTLQLISSSSEQAAQNYWDKVQSQRPEILEGYSPLIVSAEIDHKLYFRLYTKPFLDKKTATSLCERLSTEGINCFIKLAP